MKTKQTKCLQLEENQEKNAAEYLSDADGLFPLSHWELWGSAWPFLRSASEAQPERSQKTEKFKITIKLPSVFLIKEQASLIQGRAKWENAS